MLGADQLVAVRQRALARAVHAQAIEQARHSEEPVYLAAPAARDREPPSLVLEPPERIDEKMNPARVHKRDLGQVHDDSTSSALENRQQELGQRRRRLEIDFPADAEHGCVLTAFLGRQQLRRE